MNSHASFLFLLYTCAYTHVAPQHSPGPLSGRKRPLAGGTRGKYPAKKTKSQTGIVLHVQSTSSELKENRLLNRLLKLNRTSL